VARDGTGDASAPDVRSRDPPWASALVIGGRAMVSRHRMGMDDPA